MNKNLDKKEQNISVLEQIMKSNQTNWNNILFPEEQDFKQEGKNELIMNLS
jgi:hypothetical protein